MPEPIATPAAPTNVASATAPDTGPAPFSPDAGGQSVEADAPSSDAPGAGDVSPEAAEAAKAAEAKLAKERENKELRETRKELIALRKERQAIKRMKWEAEQIKADAARRIAEAEQRSKDIEGDPIEVYAKRRGLTRAKALEEYNAKFLEIDPPKKDEESPQAKELRERLERIEQERKEERERAAQQSEAYKRQAFDAETISILKSASDEAPLLATYPQHVVAAEVFSRMDKHLQATGELLDKKALLIQLEEEIVKEDEQREEARQKSRQRRQGAGASDRANGAGQGQRIPETTTPGTMTNAIASRTAGRRAPHDKERLAEGDRILFGR